jgi:hypothetical protein
MIDFAISQPTEPRLAIRWNVCSCFAIAPYAAKKNPLQSGFFVLFGGSLARAKAPFISLQAQRL